MATYRLQSCAAVYAPGVVAFAQALYAEGRTAQAVEIVNAWRGLPPDVAQCIAAGTVTTEIDADEALVVTIEGD